MNATAHLLATKANKKRLLESIAQDKRTYEGELKKKRNKAANKNNVKY
jgi:hypothetical protein